MKARFHKKRAFALRRRFLSCMACLPATKKWLGGPGTCRAKREPSMPPAEWQYGFIMPELA
ncbi:hypothetical protein [Noviherbaspirillum malthae]|uniref:hypothetical protein n=1 Tax=Noviherbaspirillum malthae TaxID=1260987 RepID=UPI00189043F9|nr:hypothetical protein [Noviherbaspirillum malthae]